MHRVIFVNVCGSITLVSYVSLTFTNENTQFYNWRRRVRLVVRLINWILTLYDLWHKCNWKNNQTENISDAIARIWQIVENYNWNTCGLDECIREKEIWKNTIFVHFWGTYWISGSTFLIAGIDIQINYYNRIGYFPYIFNSFA